MSTKILKLFAFFAVNTSLENFFQNECEIALAYQNMFQSLGSMAIKTPNVDQLRPYII